MNDPVNHPDHYTRGGYETIDFIEQYFEFSYHAGQVVKYLSRAGYKHGEDYLRDVQKAEWYARRMAARPLPRQHLPDIEHDNYIFEADLKLFADAKLLDAATRTVILLVFRGWWEQAAAIISNIESNAKKDAP